MATEHLTIVLAVLVLEVHTYTLIYIYTYSYYGSLKLVTKYTMYVLDW